MGNGQEPTTPPKQPEPGTGGKGSGQIKPGVGSGGGQVKPDAVGDEPPQNHPVLRAARRGGAMGGFIGGLIGGLIGACLCCFLHR